ncbi:FkbM family methyltransferase [Paludisphaera rhizosphaerae]|uniref:FkbM family methyltransferase n=2 Tax=Paludisphaera rhizosphaerae TaxID=2711216 RepID=UPI0028F40F32|nr:FkbM family methyltransferase [Paludisphaera rhizosphaerae]
MHRMGLYPVARGIYRAISSDHRRDRKLRRLFFAQFLKPGDLCFDIGANLGQSIEAFRASGARVVALEANALCLPTLAYSFGRDPEVLVVNKAVGSTSGTARLHFHQTASTASIRDDWNDTDDNVVEVEMITLEQLFAQHGVPRLLKVDVEGFEEQVFAGLARPVPIIYFEMHGREFDAVIRILARLESVGKIESVNAVSEDHGQWLLDRWVSPAEFATALNPLPKLANVVVRMDGSASCHV